MTSGQVTGSATFCQQCGTRLDLRRDDHRERQVCPNCGWVYYPKPNPASAVAIVENGRVLLVRRKYEPFKGQWTLPSGFMEYGEGPQKAAVREAMEELGVTVELTDLVDVVMEGGDPRGLALLIAYTGKIVEGQPRAGDDAEEVKYFPMDELPEDIAFQGHRFILEKLRPS